MKSTQLHQKRRAVSDSSEKKPRLDQDQRHFRERSFTDVLSFLSKKLKVSKKYASSNTAQQMFVHLTVPPALPPKVNNYRLNEALNKVEVYGEVSFERRMNVESALWGTKAADELPNQEAMWGEDDDDDDTDEDSEEEEAVDGPPKTTATHKRNTSGWSFGSFHIGTPVELMNEVLAGEEWSQFLENNLILPPETILSPSPYSDEPNNNLCEFETRREMPKDAAEDSNSGEEGSKSMGPNIEEILKTLKIIEEKVETPEGLKEPGPSHRLPPVLTPTSTAGVNKRFRSSVFYKYNLPPERQEPPLEAPKSGYSALGKIKAKLRKSSM